MEELINQAEDVLRTWQPRWSSFVAAPLREEAMKIMAPLNNLHWYSDGGHLGAERQRLCCIRVEDEVPAAKKPAPIQGIQIEGNFLFDQASIQDFRDSLETIGMPCDELGDLWTRGNRGAQALCTPEAANFIHQKTSRIRDVQIRIETMRVEELQLPIQRNSKLIKTVEASTRLDAIASAGFGLSRAKVVNQIKNGQLRLNWMPTKQTNRELVIGDRIQLEERGNLEILKLELTKKNRWRVELQRN